MAVGPFKNQKDAEFAGFDMSSVPVTQRVSMMGLLNAEYKRKQKELEGGGGQPGTSAPAPVRGSADDPVVQERIKALTSPGGFDPGVLRLSSEGAAPTNQQRLGVTAGGANILDPNQVPSGTKFGEARSIRGDTVLAQQDNPFVNAQLERSLGMLNEIDPSRLSSLSRQIGGLGRHTKDIDAARAAGQQIADQQAQGLEQLKALAQGQDSVVARQAELDRQRLRSQVASQLASQRGGFNPASQRAALQSASQGQVNIGAQAGIAQAQERQAALQNFLQAAGQHRDQAGQQQGREAEILTQRAGILGASSEAEQAANRARLAVPAFVSEEARRAREEALAAFGLRVRGDG